MRVVGCNFEVGDAVAAGQRREVGAAALKMERVQGRAGSGGSGGSAVAAVEKGRVFRNLAAAGFEGGEVGAGVEEHCSRPIGSHLLLHEDHKTAAA